MAVESVEGMDILGLGVAILGALVIVSPAMISLPGELGRAVTYTGEALMIFGILIASKGRSGQSSN